MTGPLVVLAVRRRREPAPAAHMLPGAAWHHGSSATAAGDFFKPGASRCRTEWLLGLTAIAAAGSSARGGSAPETLAPAANGAETKFSRVCTASGMDEIYDAVIVRPLVWVSQAFLWKAWTPAAIDGAGVSSSARGAASRAIGSWLQVGQVGTCVFFFVVGVLLILRAVAG
jgi:hypothetical protein